MAAAAITPSVVQEVQLHSDAVTGTPLRVRRFLIKGTKVTADDWILIQAALGYTDISGKIIGWTAVTVDSSNDGLIDIGTYTDSTDKMVLSSAAVGTIYLWIDVLAE